MKRFFIWCLLATLPGCGVMPGMPGYISKSTSSFDGGTEIRVEPGGVRDAAGGLVNPFTLGASWNSKAPGIILLTAVVLGDYVSIEAKRGLEFNIDGRFLSVDSPQGITDLDYSRGPGAVVYRRSTRTFAVSRKDFDAILAAKTVIARLHTARGYIDGDLSDASPGAAMEGLRRFQAELPR